MDARPDATHPQPGGPPPLVGRAREQATLSDALTAALAGHGSLVIIEGEAGIGKTALAEWLCAEAARQGAVVLTGHCYDLAESPPYGPWQEALARVPRGADRPLPPDLAGGAGVASQTALFGQVRDSLAALAARQPLVLLLEDLHWADAASLDLLRALGRQLADLPLLLLATYRADELTRRHPLDTLLPLLVREARAARLALRPLAADEVRALVRPRYALPPAEEDRLIAYLAGRAEGNPLYAGEVLRALEEGGLLRQDGRAWALGDSAAARVPSLLRQVIDGRVTRLGSEARALLVAAAVLGQDVPLALWAAVSGASAEDLVAVAERAIAARLLAEAPDGAGVRFAHALVREALYEGLGALRRPGWHRRAAAALLATAAPDPDAVAHHLRQAGDPRAVAWLVRAGLRARGAVAWLTAAERFAAAAALLAGDAARTRERAWLLFYSGRIFYFADAAQTLRHLDEAEPLALLAGDRALLAHIRFLRGTTWCLRGHVREGLAAMERAAAELDALPGDVSLRTTDDLALAVIAALLADDERAATVPTLATAPPAARLPRSTLVNWLGIAGRYREALALGEPFVPRVAAALGDDALSRAASAHQGLGHAYAACGRPDDARRAYALAFAGHTATDDAWAAEYTLWFDLLLAAIPYRADDPAERARLTAAAARCWAQARGTVAAAPHGSPADLLPALLEGRWAQAHLLAQGALATATSGYVQGATCALGLLARLQGDRAGAWARVHALHPDGPDALPGGGQFPFGLAALALAADLALDAGDRAAAGRWLAAHGRWLAWSGATLWRADHLLLQARHARAAGDLAAARHRAAQALARAADPRQPLALLAAQRLCGELATDAGRHADAAAHLEAALALAAACAAPYERALTLLALAELSWTAGRVAAAPPVLAEARAICEHLGAAPALARADRLAAHLALVRPAAYPDGLTAREVDVLRLVAAGHSNRAAAAVLAVSRRTVERHLENTYRKIAARNRADATAYAIDHGLR